MAQGPARAGFHRAAALGKSLTARAERQQQQQPSIARLLCAKIHSAAFVVTCRHTVAVCFTLSVCLLSLAHSVKNTAPTTADCSKQSRLSLRRNANNDNVAAVAAVSCGRCSPGHCLTAPPAVLSLCALYDEDINTPIMPPLIELLAAGCWHHSTAGHKLAR